MTAPLSTVASRLRDAALADGDRLRALDTKTQWELLACLRGMGEDVAAAAVLEILAAWHGPLAKVLDARADLYARLGRPDEAVAAARERIARFPSVTGGLVLARAYLAVGELDQAAEVAERLAGGAGDHPGALAILGEVALEAGDAEQALAHFERLRELHEGSAEASRGIARARAALGEEDAARAILADLAAARAEQAAAGGARALVALAGELGDRRLAAALHDEDVEYWAARGARLLEELAEAPAPPTWAIAAPSPPDTGVPTLDGVVPAPEVLAAAREYFGFDVLRTGQARTIQRVLRGEDTLAIMPTGAGKSLCYQLPAMLLPGVTVVISPLIALMQDQLESLPPSIAQVATLINSTLDAAELRRRQEGIANGAYKLVYAAPERLRQAPFLRALAATTVSLFVVDEAHCISLWGHDFRPDYLVIPEALASLGAPPLLALTATATPAMATEIGARLARNLGLVRASSFRANLFYSVRHEPNREAKLRDLVAFCREQAGSGIVYVTSRDGCEQVAHVLNRELKQRRFEPDVALAYHAGFEAGERARRMRAFMTGETRIIVATVAFGMGVDKADIRFVAHLSPASSLEAYSQESGRAGRDGRPAHCVLFYSPADKSTLKQRAKKDELDIEVLRRCYARLRRVLGSGWRVVTPTDVTPPDWDEQRDIRVALGILERAGLLERHADAPRALDLVWHGGVEPTGELWARFRALTGLALGRKQALDLVGLGEALELSPARLEQQLVDWRASGWDVQIGAARRDICLRLVLPPPADSAIALPRLLEAMRQENERRVERIVAYAASRACRHATIAAHLGERLSPCGDWCDVCQGGGDGCVPRTEAPAPPIATRPRLEGAAAALAVLNCVKALPFPLGKSGLAKVLAGSIAAPVKGDRVPGFGVLANLATSRVNELIERLIDAELLARDEQHEYRLLALTGRGQVATAEALAAFASPVSTRASHGDAPARASGPRLPSDGGGTGDTTTEPELSAADQALFARMKEWRAARARERAIPPYLIAHDRALLAVIARRPRDAAELRDVRGFGPAKVATYGAELVALVNES